MPNEEKAEILSKKSECGEKHGLDTDLVSTSCIHSFKGDETAMKPLMEVRSFEDGRPPRQGRHGCIVLEVSYMEKAESDEETEDESEEGDHEEETETRSVDSNVVVANPSTDEEAFTDDQVSLMLQEANGKADCKKLLSYFEKRVQPYGSKVLEIRASASLSLTRRSRRLKRSSETPRRRN